MDHVTERYVVRFALRGEAMPAQMIEAADARQFWDWFGERSGPIQWPPEYDCVEVTRVG